MPWINLCFESCYAPNLINTGFPCFFVAVQEIRCLCFVCVVSCLYLCVVCICVLFVFVSYLYLCFLCVCVLFVFVSCLCLLPLRVLRCRLGVSYEVVSPISDCLPFAAFLPVQKPPDSQLFLYRIRFCI